MNTQSINKFEFNLATSNKWFGEMYRQFYGLMSSMAYGYFAVQDRGIKNFTILADSMSFEVLNLLPVCGVVDGNMTYNGYPLQESNDISGIKFKDNTTNQIVEDISVEIKNIDFFPIMKLINDYSKEHDFVDIISEDNKRK